MRRWKPSGPSHHDWQVATAALVVLAGVAWACHASAAAAPGPLGAGRVNALVIDPHSPTTLYAGADCGGVLKSTDGGGTWSAANIGLPTTYGLGTTYGLAIGPTTPSTLYAETAGGVFKSMDSGGTWSPINTGQDGGIGAIAIDPTTPSKQSLGAVSGKWKM